MSMVNKKKLYAPSSCLYCKKTYGSVEKLYAHMKEEHKDKFKRHE